MQALASQFPHLVGKAVDTFLNDRFLTTDEVAILGKDRPEPDPYVPHVMVGLSLGGFHPEHPLRVRCVFSDPRRPRLPLCVCVSSALVETIKGSEQELPARACVTEAPIDVVS